MIPLIGYPWKFFIKSQQTELFTNYVLRPRLVLINDFNFKIQRVQLETELQEIMLQQAGSHSESTEDLKIRGGTVLPNGVKVAVMGQSQKCQKLTKVG